MHLNVHIELLIELIFLPQVVVSQLARFNSNDFLHARHTIFHVLAVRLQILNLGIKVFKATPIQLHRVIQSLIRVHLATLPDGGSWWEALSIEATVDCASS